MCAREFEERERKERDFFSSSKRTRKKFHGKFAGDRDPPFSPLLSRKQMNNIFVAKGVYCTVLRKKNEDGKKQKLGSDRDKRKGRLIINSEIPFSH